MQVIEEVKSELIKVFEKLGYPTDVLSLTFSDRPELCDFQSNSAFSLAKVLKSAPIKIAENIALNCPADKFKVEFCAPGFVNITLNNNYLASLLKRFDEDGNLLVSKSKPKTIVLDYGGPNVAKPLHVGHLRSAILGETVKRIAKFMGNKVISDVHLGDWGLQMGLTIAGLQNEFDLSYYFEGNGEKPNITIEDLNRIYPEASAKSKVDEEFKKYAQSITTKLQNKEKGYYDVWKDIRKISVDAIKEEYKKLNVSFDLFNGESDSQDYVPRVFEILNDKKLIEKSEGAEIVQVAKETDNAPMPPVIVRSSAGAGLYATTDIATIIERVEKFNPDEIWYTTDNRQCMHFNQVFRVCELAKIGDNKVKFVHFPFGTVNGTDGKPFKTRDGGTMRLSELIKLVRDASNKKLEENSGKKDEKLAEMIGVSALKFGDMINYRTKDYVLDIDKFCSFDGKTGPYLLYSLVRINSILQKAGEFDKKYNINSEISKKIILSIIKLSAEIENGYALQSASGICQSAFNLASDFSTLYASEKILTEPNEEKRKELLTLLSVVQKALTIVCHLLAIDIPEKM